MRIIIGAGNVQLPGWISTQENELSLLNEKQWRERFEENSISHILAEHVWEHLTYEEASDAFRICYKYLRYGGLLRIAVPDKNFRNEWYQNMVKPGGPGPVDHPAYTHKVIYDYKKLTEIAESNDFQVECLEYCDENGVFHYRYWNEEDGKIGRSFRFDTRNAENKLGMISLLIDAKKELIIKEY